MSESKSIKEVRDIREKINKEANGLTPEERVAHLNMTREKLQNEFGIEAVDTLTALIFPVCNYRKSTRA
jgi:ribosomal protein S2